MIEIYSILSQEHTCSNIVIFLPFIICLGVGSIICINEFLRIESINMKDIVEFTIKTIMVIVVLVAIISHLILNWVQIEKTKKILTDEKYKVIEGCPENISTYTIKDGEDGVEVVFSINGVYFDTGDAYGVNNKISIKDAQLMEDNYIVVKYYSNSNINGRYNIILELYIQQEEQSGDGSMIEP